MKGKMHKFEVNLLRGCLRGQESWYKFGGNGCSWQLTGLQTYYLHLGDRKTKIPLMGGTCLVHVHQLHKTIFKWQQS